MSKNLVNLNVNPCKMCMPMGSVSAFYGIKGCMSILHGSQGCSTYIRRHMATHYNEPIDIASSSLTEQGTVFGGENNLIKGLENLIALYHPEVIGVATTCLAETIGEDIDRIIKKFHLKHPENDVKIIPVFSSGYSGTQYEGFFAALKAIVFYTEMKTEKNHKINIVTGMISPADTRYLKNLLDSMGVEYILLPDVSENLDGIYQKTYERLPEYGTTVDEIAEMAGAQVTIELSPFVKDQYSPGKYLEQAYGVPYVRCNLPVGLRDTDAFINVLKQYGGVVSESLRKERGRYLDAMVDSHKYNAEGKAVVFGEPDFVSAVSQLCTENGMLPVVAVTGTKSEPMKAALEPKIQSLAQRYFVEKTILADGCDFDRIEQYAEECDANLMIGNSDGRRVAHKLDIPLVRCAFPVHDHVGGQRIRMLGYEGSLMLLDRMTNALMERKEHGFREKIYREYYRGATDDISMGNVTAALPAAIAKKRKITAAEKTKTHPCFNGCGSEYARMHLPIAPKCNIQCNYCVRKYDCVNESRPGVTTQVLSPQEAFEKYMDVKERMPNLKVVGIAGPGDSLREFEKTKQTLELIRTHDPDVTFCLSTNGLMLPVYAEDLVALDVTHVTITMNAVDPTIGAKIYRYVDYMGKRYRGEIAAAILLANQLAGLEILAKHGVVCKVNIVALKGINDHHIPEVVQTVKDLGAEITNIMQLIPVKGSAFEKMPLTSLKEITELRKECGSILKQMYHCKQCRADAIGTLDDDRATEFCSDSVPCIKSGEPLIGTLCREQEEPTLRFAVSSKGGMHVDQHFGQASDFYIYEYQNGDVTFKERRSVDRYCEGSFGCDGQGGGKKQFNLEQILKTVEDCDCIITMRIGESPKQKLASDGVTFMESYGRIEDAVLQAVTTIYRKEAAMHR